MGTVISASAAREDIVIDANKTLAAAAARGGNFATEAAERLGPLLTLYTAQETETKASSGAAGTARAQRAAANGVADDLVVEVADDLFEAGGRRRNDPFLALVLPGGARPIIGGAIESQPTRMRVAAKLLAKTQHPRIPKSTYDAAAERLNAGADALGAVIDQTRTPIAQADVSDEILTSLARLVRAELMSFKRSLIGQGFSETEVHTIIPDRPEKPGEPEKKED